MADFSDLLRNLPADEVADANTAGSPSDQAKDPEPKEPENPADPQDPKEPKEPEAKDKVPFHKHPRFVQINQNLKKAQETITEKDKRIAELEAQLSGGGSGEQKKEIADMSAEEYNDYILSEARRIAQEEAGKLAPKPQKSQEQAQAEVLDQIDQEFSTIRDLDDDFSDTDEEAVIELCMNPPEDLKKIIGDRKVATIKEAYKFYRKQWKNTVPPEKRKNAEVKTWGSGQWGGNSEYKFQTLEDLKKAGQRALGGGR